MLDVKKLLEEIKASPFEEIEVTAPHTGVIHPASASVGDTVRSAFGAYKEKPGTVLLHLERERNKKPVYAPQKGELVWLAEDQAGRFAQAGQKLAVIRHYLTRDEVIERILKQALHLVAAPEKAKYYFVPEVDLKIKASGAKSVKVRPGMDLFIVSRMKRESVLDYQGPEGIVYAVYFQPGENMAEGAPLVGVCPETEIEDIRAVVNRVQSEWKENGEDG
ncbi:MAG: biotin attachment protein [Desulfovibrionaceae bacterium]